VSSTDGGLRHAWVRWVQRTYQRSVETFCGKVKKKDVWKSSVAPPEGVPKAQMALQSKRCSDRGTEPKLALFQGEIPKGILDLR
jgi:hypothetical protein